MKPPCENSFQEIILDAAERLQARLVRYASRFFDGDVSRAQDVVQHAFLQLCRTAAPKRPHKVDQWLFRVCRNRAIDLQRHNGRHLTGQLDNMMDRVDEQLIGVGEKFSERELFELVHQRMVELPESQRESIELWSNGFTYAEVAEVMDRPESTVRVLVHRAITRLRQDKQLAAAIGHEPVPKPTNEVVKM